MLIFHPVEVEQDLARDNPLFVGNFFHLKGMWWNKRKIRQGLIISIAVAWYHLTKKNAAAPGFMSEEILITALTQQVSDAKHILEQFFTITQLGYNFGDGNKQPTQVSPRKLPAKMVATIINIVDEVRFNPGLPPTNKKLTKSSLKLQSGVAVSIIQRLKITEREDLIPAVTWLLKHTNIDFYYEPAGTLLARDKSVWPIKSIEMWPGWLRTALFGRVIDLENAYCQFIMKSIEPHYAAHPHKLKMKYPDLVSMDVDKTNYRIELCRDYLKLEPTDKNIGLTKRLLMSLANGSNATPSLMTNGSGRSEAVRIVHEMNPDLLPSDMITIGNKLSSIAKQFKNVKKDMCLHLLKVKPTRENQKQIFKMYFEWERKARYQIWEAVGQTGLHLHDGIDGIESELDNEALVNHIASRTSLRVSVDSPDACCA
jgi:hypothetical protein